METATENVIPTLTLIKGGNEKKTEYIIVVGRTEVDHEKLAQNGLLVVEHWKKLPSERPCIPLQVDRILLLSDAVDLLLAKTAQDIAEKEALPITFTHSSLNTLSQDLLSKTREPKDDVAEVVEHLTNAVRTNKMTTTNTETHVDGRSIGANVQAKEEKLNYVRELLAKDPMMPTANILAKVQKKFKRGLTPTSVHELRENEFGVKFGPRGTVKTAGNQPAKKAAANTVVEATETTNRPVKRGDRKEVTNRLGELLANLQAEMQAQGILLCKLPASGTAQIVYETVSEVSIPQLH